MEMCDSSISSLVLIALLPLLLLMGIRVSWTDEWRGGPLRGLDECIQSAVSLDYRRYQQLKANYETSTNL